MSFRIHIYVDGKETGTYEVRRGDKLVLGRESTNDIVVFDRSVSRRHCTVSHTLEGLEVADLESANGVYFDGEPRDRVVLKDGGQVSLGMAQLRVTNTATHTGMIPLSGIAEALAKEESNSGLDSGSEASESSSGLLSGPDVPYIFREPESVSLSASDSILSESSEYRSLEKDRLLYLVELGKSLAQSLDLEIILNRILDQLFKVLPVRRAVVALTDDGENFSARVTRPESEDLGQVASQGVLKQVVAAREGQIIEDASLDQKLRSNVSVVASNIRAAVCAPIVVNDRSLGAIYADFPGRPRLYSQNDLDFLTAFASIAGVALVNSRMAEQIRKSDRLKRDLEIAAEIQQGILPSEAFAFPGLEIDWAYVPSLNVGGDFYDVIPLDEGRYAFILGDVSGKSVPAALYMARSISILRATVSPNQTPGEVLSKTNRILSSGKSERVIFATTIVCIIDVNRRRLSWSSAGHNPGLLRDPATGVVHELSSCDVPLGVLDDVDYETEEMDIPVGAYLTLYTDGLVEARSTSGEELGLDRVNAIVDEYINDPVGTATKAMIEAIRVHHANSPHMLDDVAILNIRIL